MSEQVGVKAETARWVLGMGLAALVSYFSTTYGLQARIDVLESRVQASESNIKAVADLSRELADLNRKVAVLTAIMERIEEHATDGQPVRRARQFDH